MNNLCKDAIEDLSELKEKSYLSFDKIEFSSSSKSPGFEP